jgi:dipeptidyl aminopeptidase/acylaminoacyl peptidase
VQFLYPHFLPPESGGRTLVLAVARGEGQSELAVLRLETGRWQTLGPGARPVYSRTGHILYESNPPGGPPSVWAIPFSLKTRQAIGQSFAVAENAIRPSVAEDGTLVYLSNPPTTETRLVWRDRNGRYVGRLEQTQSGLGEPALSPDGRFVAVSAKEGRNANIWVQDIARGVKTRLTSFPGDDSRPIWSPDGREIAFSREHRDLFLMSADGSAKEKVLLDSPGRESIEDWSADGNYIVYTVRDPRTDFDLWYLQRSSGGYKAKPFSQAPFQERAGRVSPDSRFLAYCTDESGGWEVYVQRFPEGGSRVQVSGHGGSQPRWRRDGKELFYVEGDSLIAVRVTTRPDFKVQATRRLFRHANLRNGVPFARYDVSPAGDRFLLIEPAEAAPSQSIHVVQNWFAEFRRKQ